MWEIWSEKKNADHFDQIGLSGEKKRQIFAQINQSDMIWEKERNQWNTSLLFLLDGISAKTT